MNKKLLTFVILNFLFFGLSGQDFKGIWLSEYVEEIQSNTTTSVFEEDSLFVKELGYIRVDTNYYNSYLMIDFISKDSLLFGGLGGKKTVGRYFVSNDTLRIKLDTLIVKAIYDEKFIKVLDSDSSWSNSTVFLSQLDTDEFILKNISSELFLNTKWLSNADTSSTYHGLEFYFYDSINAIITQKYGERAYTSFGTYRILHFQNIPFLAIFDRKNLEQYIFLLVKRNNSDQKITVASYELAKWLNRPPKKQDFELTKKTLPSTDEIENIHNKLIGQWSNNNNPLPFDTIYSDYDSLIDSYFKINFNKDKSYSIEYGGRYSTDSRIDSKNIESEGTWLLGGTGDYIELKSSNQLEHMTILNIDKRNLSLTYDIELPDVEIIISGTLIDLNAKRR